MKRKPNPEKADIENPAWTKATFACARAADAVLPETFGEATALRRSRTSATGPKPPDRRGADDRFAQRMRKNKEKLETPAAKPMPAGRGAGANPLRVAGGWDRSIPEPAGRKWRETVRQRPTVAF